MSHSIFQRAAGRLHRLLFGVDVFISYARTDGAAYAQALAYALSGPPDRLSCGFDHWETRPGATPPDQLLRVAQDAAGLVVVASAAALKSAAVDLEIQAFTRKPGPIVIVTFDGSEPLESAMWHARIAGVARQVEPGGLRALELGEPHERVLQRARATSNYWKRNRRVGVTLQVGLASLGIAIAGAATATAWATREVDRGAEARRQANKATGDARRAAALAREAGARSASAQAAATAAAGRAVEAASIAAAAERRASEATARVQQQLAISRSRQRLAQAAEVFRGGGDIENWSATTSLALAAARQAVRELGSTAEGLTDADEVYIRTILNDLPSVAETGRSGVEMGALSDDGRTIAASDSEGRIMAWDRRTGASLPSPPEGALYGRNLRAFAWQESETQLRLRWEGGELAIPSPTGRSIRPVQVGSDGAFVAVAAKGTDDDDGPWELHLIRPRTGSTPILLCKDIGDVVGAHLSQDDSRLASGCGDRIRVWDTATGGEVAEVEPPPGRLVDIQFNFDASRLAVGTPSYVALWALDGEARRIASHRVVGEDEDEDFVEQIGLDPPGQRIAINLDHEAIFCVDGLSGQQVSPQFASWEWGERGRYMPLPGSPTASYRLTDRGVIFRDACSGERLGRVVLGSPIESVLMNGSLHAATIANERGDLFIADLTPASLYAERVVEGEVRTSTATKQTHLILTKTRLQVWDVVSGATLFDLSGDFTGAVADISADGGTVALLDRGGLRVWTCVGSERCMIGAPLTFGSPIRPGQGDAGQYSNFSVFTDYVLVSTASRAQLLRIGPQGLEEVTAPADFGRAFPLLGPVPRIAFTTQAGSIRVWNAEGGPHAVRNVQLAGRIALGAPVIGYPPTSNRLFVQPPLWNRLPPGGVAPADADVAQLIDADTLEVVVGLALRTRNAPLLAASQDGRFLAAAENPTNSTPERRGPEVVEVVDLRVGRIAASIPTEEHAREIAFGAHGHLAIALNERIGGESGYRLQVFEPVRWRKVLDVLTTSRVDCLAFGPGDETLAAGQRDGATLVVDRRGQRLLNAPQQGGVVRCDFADEGRRLVTIGSTPVTTTLRITPATRAALVERLLNVQIDAP